MATCEEAMAVRDQLSKRLDLLEAGAKRFGIMVNQNCTGYAVRIGFDHGPIPDLPNEIDGVPINIEITV